jgi:hypothetical protein
VAEPKALVSARKHLAQAEARFGDDEGLVHLQEGLALLEDVIDGEAAYAEVATNLASAYASRIYGRAEALITGDPGLPETQCERLFKLLLAFDQASVVPPARAGDVKVALVRRLIDCYYEGHSAADKERAVRQLLEVSVGG